MRRNRYYQESEKAIDIEELRWIWYSIESEGGIFIGNNGNSQCVLASDGSNDLAKLQIAPGENLSSILIRLNNATKQCVENGNLVDEVQGRISITDVTSDS